MQSYYFFLIYASIRLDFRIFSSLVSSSHIKSKEICTDQKKVVPLQGEKDYTLHSSCLSHAHLGRFWHCGQRSIGSLYSANTYCVAFHNGSYPNARYWLDFPPKQYPWVAASGPKGPPFVSLRWSFSALPILHFRDLYLPKFCFADHSRSHA